MNTAWANRERIKAVTDAESFLVDFSNSWANLPAEYRPGIIKHAFLHLVVLTLAAPVRAEIWLRQIATAADVPKSKLREQINKRVWMHTHNARLLDDRRTRQQFETALMEAITL